MKIKHGATIVLEFITIGLSDEGNMLEKGKRGRQIFSTNLCTAQILTYQTITLLKKKIGNKGKK